MFKKIYFALMIPFIFACILILIFVIHYKPALFSETSIFDFFTKSAAVPVVVGFDELREKYIVKKINDLAAIEITKTAKLFFLNMYGVAAFDSNAITTTTPFILMTSHGGFSQKMPGSIKVSNVTVSTAGAYIFIEGSRVDKNGKTVSLVRCIRETVAQKSEDCIDVDKMFAPIIARSKSKLVGVKWDNFSKRMAVAQLVDSKGVVTYWAIDPWETKPQSASEDIGKRVFAQTSYFDDYESRSSYDIAITRLGFLSVKPNMGRKEVLAKTKPTLIFPLRVQKTVWINSSIIAVQTKSGEWNLVDLDAQKFARIEDLAEVFSAMSVHEVPSLTQ
jgi:hypothetical protein